MGFETLEMFKNNARVPHINDVPHVRRPKTPRTNEQPFSRRHILTLFDRTQERNDS